ncbi:DUF885 family protein [Sphingobium sp. SYK-6]|uniref:DUF885 family protein n=1 Tax=Sphingobium sp. (strain NBRC 103272 / SYK-6) TaxID=627192 RepID=UPI001314F23A|nr:DUF885 family protein [Sphingobium sp. SYK-6]
MFRLLPCLAIVCMAIFPSSRLAAQPSSSAQPLEAVITEALAVREGEPGTPAFAAAAEAYRGVLAKARQIDRDRLGLDDQVDHDLLIAHVRTRLFEMETLRLHEVTPAFVFALEKTNRLFIRPGALSDGAVKEAASELRALPAVLARAKQNLKNPARTWTENGIYQAYYARLLLKDYVPTVSTDDPAVKRDLIAAAGPALAAVDDFTRWLKTDLLPRSTRAPAWKPEEIEFYQFVQEQLDDYSVEEMLRIAEGEERVLLTEMRDLARQIHPSGDLRTTWEAMKNEAPPWDHVVPMAQRYVDMMSDWLRGPGAHIVTIPDYIDYGARLTPPMGRRILSFGGATGGPTVAGRQSGYYVLTPLEDILTPEERASRIKSYNPYWTHVISYHEWLGHNVQIASRNQHVTRPMRRAYRSAYFSQSWSFYLERLMEEEGYYKTLPYMEELKTRMARRQMRMWRVQRILTKLRMARGEMTFDQAVAAYVEKIGMEPTNAFIEVQRDSQTPASPGREIIGELEIVKLREEYKRRMGEHYSMKHFHDTLLTYGDLPFKQIRMLMFRE